MWLSYVDPSWPPHLGSTPDSPSRGHRCPQVPPSWGKFQTQLLLELESCSLECNLHVSIKIDFFLWLTYHKDPPGGHRYPQVPPNWGKFKSQFVLELESFNSEYGLCASTKIDFFWSHDPSRGYCCPQVPPALGQIPRLTFPLTPFPIQTLIQLVSTGTKSGYFSSEFNPIGKFILSLLEI